MIFVREGGREGGMEGGREIRLMGTLDKETVSLWDMSGDQTTRDMRGIYPVDGVTPGEGWSFEWI